MFTLNFKSADVTKGLIALVVFLLVLCTWQVSPYQISGDSAYEAVLEHAYVQNWQFGKDIVYTSGPFSFLSSMHSTGETIWLKAIWNVFRSLLLTYLLFQIARRLSPVTASIFVIGSLILVMPNVHFIDRKDIFILGIGGYLLLSNRRNSLLFIVTFLAYAATVSHAKFVNFLLVCVLCFLLLLLGLSRRQFMSAILAVLYVSLSYLAVYVFSGQRFEYLFSYLISSFEITAGYSEAMARGANFPIFTQVGIGLMAACASLICYRFWRCKSVQVAFISVWLCALLFLSLKHGFSRDDAAHRLSFFAAVFWLFWLLVLTFDSKDLDKRVFTWIAGALSCLALIAVCVDTTGSYQDYLSKWVVGTPSRARLLWPPRAEASLKREQDAIVSRSQFEQLKRIIGDRTVDVYGRDQGLALMSQMNFTPRPVFQSMTVHTPYLEQLNRDFYKSDDSPEFVVMNYHAPDWRLPSFSDSGLVLSLLIDYKLTHSCYVGSGQYQKSLLVFSRREQPVEITYELVDSGRVNGSDKSLDLSEYNQGALWLEMEHKPSLAYRFANFLWKPPIIYIKTETEGDYASNRWIPGMTQSGFLINPLLMENSDFVTHLKGEPARLIKRLSLHNGLVEEVFSRELGFEYKLYRLNGLSFEKSGL